MKKRDEEKVGVKKRCQGGMALPLTGLGVMAIQDSSCFEAETAMIEFIGVFKTDDAAWIDSKKDP